MCIAIVLALVVRDHSPTRVALRSEDAAVACLEVSLVANIFNVDVASLELLDRLFLGVRLTLPRLLGLGDTEGLLAFRDLDGSLAHLVFDVQIDLVAADPWRSHDCRVGRLWLRCSESQGERGVPHALFKFCSFFSTCSLSGSMVSHCASLV